MTFCGQYHNASLEVQIITIGTETEQWHNYCPRSGWGLFSRKGAIFLPQKQNVLEI